MTGITPRVISREEIITATQRSDFDLGYIVALPVIADYGSITPQTVNNRQLLNTYTDGDIARSSDVSLKIATALSRHCNVVTVRVSNTEVLSGVTNKGTKVYIKDGEYYSDILAKTPYTPTSEDLFIVYSISPLELNVHSLAVTKAWYASDGSKTETLGTVVITLRNGSEVSMNFSLDVDSVDGFGTSNLIENLNTRQTELTVVALRTKDDGITSCPILVKTVFGASGYSHSITSERNSTTSFMSDTSAGYVIEALNRIARYRSSMNIKEILDGGLVHSTIISNLEIIARKRRALGSFTHPSKYRKNTEVFRFYQSPLIKDQIKDNQNDSSFLYTCSPWRRDGSYFPWVELFPMTMFATIKRIDNFNANQEYLPMFGSSQGTVNGANLTVTFSHSTDDEEVKLDDWTEGADPLSIAPDTEQLQRLSCNPVIFDEALQRGYFVNNLTFQTANLNEMSDENNRRHFNDSQADLNSRFDQFIAQGNDDITREDIGNAIVDYFENVVFRQRYTINDYRYDIEPYDPAARNDVYVTVEINFKNSTKYIKVLYRSVPVIG